MRGLVPPDLYGGGANWACLASLIKTCLCRAPNYAEWTWFQYEQALAQPARMHMSITMPLGIVPSRRADRGAGAGCVASATMHGGRLPPAIEEGALRHRLTFPTSNSRPWLS
jgi:hypothetical protein